MILNLETVPDFNLKKGGALGCRNQALHVLTDKTVNL